jgi:hypothetical protein
MISGLRFAVAWLGCSLLLLCQPASASNWGVIRYSTAVTIKEGRFCFPLQYDQVSLSSVLDTGANNYLYAASQKGRMALFGSKQISDNGNNPTFVKFNLLGSGTPAWLPGGFEDYSEQGFDCVIPVNAVDSDYLLFIKSRRKLLLADFTLSDQGSAFHENMVGKGLPFFQGQMGLYVALRVENQDCYAILDTGSPVTIFTPNFVTAHPNVFNKTNKRSNQVTENGGQGCPIYTVKSGATLLGVTADDDVKLSGKFCAGIINSDRPIPVGDIGDQNLLPYYRPDPPRLAPVALIGMDVLESQQDFVIDFRDHIVCLLDPAYREAFLGPK